MSGELTTYESVNEMRMELFDRAIHPYQLNEFHEQLIRQVVRIAEGRVNREWENAPAPFTFFLTGSAGRFEQAIWSDQDHGIIYEHDTRETRKYFQQLGNEIVKGLEVVGYPRCEGNVMASNPMWCQSFEEWQSQLASWIEKGDFDSVRYILIFFDARCLLGNPQFVTKLKTMIMKHAGQFPHLLRRMSENTNRIQKPVGVFGQFLLESYGPYKGLLNIKEKGFLPYVNAVRLMAVKVQVMEVSTLGRLNKLSFGGSSLPGLQTYREDFEKLLNYRFLNQQKPGNYEDVHYLDVKSLPKQQKKEVKRLLRNGVKLYHNAKNLIEKR